MDLFVYGTLMQEPIQRQLLGRPLAGASATLFGFRRCASPTSYPYVVADAGSQVAGVLLRRLSAGEIAILDEYEDEGRLYLRRSLTVRVATIDQAAQVYVGILPAVRHVRRSYFDQKR